MHCTVQSRVILIVDESEIFNGTKIVLYTQAVLWYVLIADCTIKQCFGTYSRQTDRYSSN